MHIANLSGAVFWVLLAALQLGRVPDAPLALLPAALSLLVGVRLVLRRPAGAEAPVPCRLAAYGACVLPLAVRVGTLTPTAALLYAGGLLLALWALAALGPAFGIAPARRGLVFSGPYRLVRHPMYLGEILAFSGLILAAPSVPNLLLYAAAWLLTLYRIRVEEALLSADPAYAAYRRRTPYRLVPFLF